jgi:hypothetical protein
MKISVIGLALVLLLAVSAGAMQIKGDLATTLGFATTSTGITTHNGSDIQRASVVYTPSTFAGFASPKYIYVEGKDAEEARTTASQIMGYGIRNLTARVYSGTMRSGDLKVNLTKKSVSGSEGASNSNSSSYSSSYGHSTRRGPYFTSNSSSGGSSSGMEAAVVYSRYGFSLEMKAPDGQMDIIPVLNIPVGGSESATTSEHSTDRYSSSHNYSYRRGSSSSYSSSSSSSSMHRSPEVEREMAEDRIADRSSGNIAALVIDAITNAALSGQIPGAIFETYKSPQPTTPAQNNGQNISAPLH